MNAKDKQVGGGHYDMPIQPLEFSMKNGLNACQANVIKYVCRYDLKYPLNPEKQIEDLEKAVHYIEWLIDDIIRDNKVNRVEQKSTPAYNAAAQEKISEEEKAWDRWRDGQGFRRFNEPPRHQPTKEEISRRIAAYEEQRDCIGGACDV